MEKSYEALKSEIQRKHQTGANVHYINTRLYKIQCAINLLKETDCHMEQQKYLTTIKNSLEEIKTKINVDIDSLKNKCN